MHTLSLDTYVRCQIAEAIRTSHPCETIDLPDGSQLRVLSHFGHIAFEHIDDADLFAPHVDVSWEVMTDMEEHPDWVWLFR
jgi:hypothetical protein